MTISINRGVLVSAMLLIPGAVLTSQQSNPPQRIPQFENADVAVWKTTVMPNAPLQMHTHDHPRVIVALQGGTMKILEESGQSELHEWQTGKAYWLPANPPGTRHQDVNVSREPIEVMVVELQKAK